jgi:hypothetical protein
MARLSDARVSVFRKGMLTKEKSMAQVGKWALIVGLLIAVLGAFSFPGEWFVLLLVVLGILAGAGGAWGGETSRFLIPSMALLVAVNAAGSLPWIGGTASLVIANGIAFLCPAVVVVALKSLFGATRS